jgi:hypothetical protein
MGIILMDADDGKNKTSYSDLVRFKPDQNRRILVIFMHENRHHKTRKDVHHSKRFMSPNIMTGVTLVKCIVVLT